MCSLDRDALSGPAMFLDFCIKRQSIAEPMRCVYCGRGLWEALAVEHIDVFC